MRQDEALQAALSNPHISLSDMVEAMVGAPHPYRCLRGPADGRQQLFDLLNMTIDRFSSGDNEARWIVHRALSRLYELHLSTPSRSNVRNQFDPLLMEIMQELESAWEAHEDARVPDLPIPEEPRHFATWLKRLVLEHRASNHPLFKFLEKQATRRQMADFFREEITVDSRFDDLVALAQIGLEGGPKMELAENFWDEMGNGDAGLVHTTMFKALLEELEVVRDGDVHCLLSQVTWQAMASGNLLIFSVLKRQNTYKALGALGATEMVAPMRFKRLLRGFERLGLSPGAKKYHALHIGIDARHGHGWLHNAIVPAAATGEEARRDIVRGTFFRLNTSGDQCDLLYQRYTSDCIA